MTTKTCTCDAYEFPHRPGSGKCQVAPTAAIGWQTHKRALIVYKELLNQGHTVALNAVKTRLHNDPDLTAAKYFQNTWLNAIFGG